MTSGDALPRLLSRYLLVLSLSTAMLLVPVGAALAAPPPTPDYPASIDTYARYEGQTGCSAVEQPGVQDVRTMLQRQYGANGGGILRPCNVGGTSEHKEGRAYDWMLDANKLADKAKADEFLTWLLATDRHGNQHAMARRLGVMYVIWDRRVWSAYRPTAGWQAYTGTNPHTDHIHLSFSWDGAKQRTSYWTYQPEATPEPPPPPAEPTWLEGDVNGDGSQDVIGFDPATGDWLAILHDSDTVTRWGNYRTRDGWSTHVPGDFNGDGRTDVLSFHQPTGRWWLNTSTGTNFTSRATTTFTTRDGWSDHLAADLNGDGTHTLLSLHPATGRWFTTNTTPTGATTTRWAQLPPARTWGTHQIGNFDGHPNGAQQLVSFDTTDGNWHHTTDTGGTATTRPWGRYNTRTGWSTHLVGNFRSQDRDDIASYHPGTGTWWVSAPDTTTGINATSWARFKTNTGWQTHTVGDIDRNGRDSIISYHPGAGSAWISDSTGTNFTLNRWTTYKTRTGWTHHTILHPNHGTAQLASYHPTTRRWFTTTAPEAGATTTRWVTVP